MAKRWSKDNKDNKCYKPITNITDIDSDKDNDKEKDIYRRFAHLSMSVSEFNKLEADYEKKTIDSCIDSIENFKNNKKYKSLYLTCKNWLKKEQTKHELKTLNKFKAPWE